VRKKGSGTVTSAPIEVTPFSAIEASHHFAVRVVIGSPESATLRVDDNLLDAVDGVCTPHCASDCGSAR
jgi:hypothetical protein